MNATVKSKMARRYNEEFKRQAVELVIHGGKTQRQVAGELDVSEYSLNLWKKQYLSRQPSAEINAQEQSPAQMAELIRQQHKEIEYLKRQREILKKAMSILGEEPGPGMR
jgi:transposase-like protein